MSTKQVIVVFGATGAQGGSVVRSILADKKASARFHVKAVTRNPSSDKADALRSQGAEVVTADLNDPGSLRQAFQGAYGVFAVTNFWEHSSKEAEVQQGKNVADACKEEGVRHLVWSSLLNVTELTNGVLSQVHHFDSKAEVEEYIRASEIPATFFLAGSYMSNFPGQSLRQMPDGKWGFALPVPSDTPFPLIATEEDTGKFVKAILLRGEAILGKRIYGAAAYVTPEEMLSAFKQAYPVAGEGATYTQLPHVVFKRIFGEMGMSETAQEEILQTLRLMAEFGYYGGESLEDSTKIVDEPLITWKEFIKKAPAFAGLQ